MAFMAVVLGDWQIRLPGDTGFVYFYILGRLLEAYQFVIDSHQKALPGYFSFQPVVQNW